MIRSGVLVRAFLEDLDDWNSALEVDWEEPRLVAVYVSLNCLLCLVNVGLADIRATDDEVLPLELPLQFPIATSFRQDSISLPYRSSSAFIQALRFPDNLTTSATHPSVALNCGSKCILLMLTDIPKALRNVYLASFAVKTRNLHL